MEEDQGAVPSPADDTAAADSPTADESQDSKQTAQPDDQNATDEQPIEADDSRSEEESTERKGFSHHQQKRFRKMSEKIRSQADEIRNYQPQQQQPYQPDPQNAPGFYVDPNKEYTTTELQNMAEQYAATTGRALASMEVQQLRSELERKELARDLESRYHNDLSYVEKTHPELNEDSEDFDPQLAERIAKRYERELKLDPQGASLKEIADDYVWAKRRREGAEAGSEAAEGQAANAAPPPGQKSTRATRVTADWLQNQYDPKNPEHRKLVDEYSQRMFG